MSKTLRNCTLFTLTLLTALAARTGAQTYCTPPPSTYACQSGYISNVLITGGSMTIDNTSGCAPSSYTYFSDATASQVAGGTLNIKISTGGNNLYYRVYIDYNDDGDFADASEANLYGQAFDGFATINIPADAPLGMHRLRIRSDRSTYPFACNIVSYGETEDYNLTIVPPCSGLPSAGSISASVPAACLGIPFTLSIAGNTDGTIVQWQFSINGTNFSNLPSGTSSTYTTTQNDKRYYRAAVKCPASSQTAYTNVITMNMAAPGLCPVGLNLDGTNDYAEGTVAALPQGNEPRTIMLWAKSSSTAAGSMVNWGLSTTNHRFGIIRYANSIYIVGENNDYNTGVSFSDGEWHHLAVTFNGTRVDVYKDGDFIGGIAKTFNTTGTTLRLGQRVLPQANEFYNGTMDEISIWSRALCQSEIQHNMQGTLPTGQAGLVAYYKLDDGSPGANNTSVNMLQDASGSNQNPTLYNFAKTGTTSNFVDGRVYNSNVELFVAPPVTATTTSTQTISGSTNFDVNCMAIAQVTPTGANPISGTVTTKVTVDANSGMYLNVPYVKRHYDIEPATNPNTATATVKLYFLQSEFADYNAAANSPANLPLSGDNSDPNKANIRITQYHGTSTTGLPGSYTYTGNGPAVQELTPTEVNWNASANCWEVTVEVSGFSGFFATGASSTPLPLKLLTFNAANIGAAGNKLHWEVAEEARGTAYTITKSSNGTDFAAIGTERGTGSSASYDFVDHSPAAGMNYYRLEVEEPGAKTSYSAIASVYNATQGAGIAVFPVPAREVLELSNTTTQLVGTRYTVFSADGRQIASAPLALGINKVDISTWAPGVYTIRFANGAVLQAVKQ